MSSVQTIPETLAWAKVPLSVYREVAAHLRQVPGVEVELLPQTSPQFDYTLGQIGGLRIAAKNLAGPEDEARVLEILNYYGDRFGAFEIL
ncbi:hypothetical protein [Altericista sp. CCNU0014]|uniref:hypothetical protein n=1 Tax=Altericista sp. CCNU0014 TaxID=3082949 RepID=UPI00384DEB5C